MLPPEIVLVVVRFTQLLLDAVALPETLNVAPLPKPMLPKPHVGPLDAIAKVSPAPSASVSAPETERGLEFAVDWIV